MADRLWLDKHVAGMTACDTLFCVPVIEPPTNRPVEQWDVGPGVLVVDHTPGLTWQTMAAERGWRYVGVGVNLGTNGAWNVGRQILLAEYRPTDLLVLMSAYCDFPQGLTEVSRLLRLGASWEGCGAIGFAWHLVALSGLLLAEIGTFDENLSHYYGDNDYIYRGILGGHFLAEPSGFRHIDLGTEPPQSGGALRSGKMEPVDFSQYGSYFRAKWGGNASEEQFATPFDLPVPTGWWSPRYRPTISEGGEPGWLPVVEGAGASERARP